MVLWEITLATAYFLGLKRTYRLALRIQRRLIAPTHPRARRFVQGKTRTVFDMALKVHKSIQEKDIEVGQNLGKRILRWLDRMKPSAQIRGPPEVKPQNGVGSSLNMTRQVTNSAHQKNAGSIQPSRNLESDRHLFTSVRNRWYKPFPSIVTAMRPPRLTGISTPYRQLTTGPEIWRSTNKFNGVSRFDGVFRRDIMQYLLQN